MSFGIELDIELMDILAIGAVILVIFVASRVVRR